MPQDNKIKIRRGLDANLPDFNTEIGELRYSTDTKKLYIDDGTANRYIGGDVNAFPISTATQQALNNKLDKDGNAATATALQTARTLTIGNTGKSFDGSGNVSWSLAEIGAQSILTNPITGTGTTNLLPKFTSSGILGNSLIYDNGTNVGIGSTSPLGKLHVVQNDTSTVAAIIQGGLFGALIQGGSAISNYALSVTNSSSSSLLYVRGDGNVGIGTGSPSEKLDVNGNVKANGFKTPIGTTTQALTADGGVFDLNLKLSIESPTTTGTVISFSTDRVYGTLVTPETGNITADITNAKLGVTNIIIHNSGTAPTFGSQFKKLSGSGNYVVGVVNYIYCTFITTTEIIYSINQRA